MHSKLYVVGVFFLPDGVSCHVVGLFRSPGVLASIQPPCLQRHTFPLNKLHFQNGVKEPSRSGPFSLSLHGEINSLWLESDEPKPNMKRMSDKMAELDVGRKSIKNWKMFSDILSRRNCSHCIASLRVIRLIWIHFPALWGSLETTRISRNLYKRSRKCCWELG